jgi:hypothetical protein
MDPSRSDHPPILGLAGMDSAKPSCFANSTMFLSGRYNVNPNDGQQYFANPHNPYVGSHTFSINHDVGRPLSERNMINATDFTNKLELLHNNIPTVPHLIHPQQFTIIIDSIDRDVDLYPNPFNYRVIIGPQIQQRIKEYMRDPSGNIMRDRITKKILINEKVIGTSGPFIKDPLIWIKNIRLDHAVFPRSYTFDLLDETKNSPLSNILDHKTLIPLLEGDRCIQVHIPELEKPCKYSTNDGLSESFAVLIDHYNINPYFFISTNRCRGSVYLEALDKLNTMSISIRDSGGEQLKYNYLKSCKCCSSNMCYNVCCGINNFNKNYSYGGGVFVDFVKPTASLINFSGLIDLITKKFVDGIYVVEYDVEIINSHTHKLILVGYVNPGIPIDLVCMVKQIVFGTYELSFIGFFNNIKTFGYGKINLDSSNYLSGILNIRHGYENITLNATFNLILSASVITINPSKIEIIRRSQSIENYIKINIPYNDLNDDVKRISGNVASFINTDFMEEHRHPEDEKYFDNLVFNGTIDFINLKIELNISGIILGKKINITINFFNNVGAILGQMDDDIVSLIITVTGLNVNITGTIGVLPINYNYILPINLLLNNAGLITGSSNITFCYNIDTIDTNIIPKCNMTLNLTTNYKCCEILFGYLFNVNSNGKYLGSVYNFNVGREVLDLDVKNNIFYYNGDTTSNLLFVKMSNIMKLKTNAVDYDVVNKVLKNNTTMINTQLYGNDDVCLSNMKKIFISFLKGDCEIIHEECKDACCDCVISLKDKRLQHQLHFTVEVLIDYIPLVNNKQN